MEMKRWMSGLLAACMLFSGGLAEQPEGGSAATPVPATEAPATQTPATQTSATEAPTATASATDVPATDAPATDAPATDAPSTDAPATDAPTTDAPATDTPSTDAPATDAPSTDAPPTDAPTTDTPATDAPTQSPEASATPAPVLEGFLLDADGRKLRGGALAELLAEPGELRVCISTRKTVLLENFPLARLREITFEPDADLNTPNFRVVCSLSDSLQDEISPEDVEGFAEDALGKLYIWLREELPGPSDTPAPERALSVRAEGYLEGAWSCVQPEFFLSGIGEGDEGCAYAVIILDERIALLSEDVYRPEEEGVYGVRFAIMDEMGDLTERSEKYNLWLDYTAPELSIEVSQEKARSMTLYFADALSGAEALSLDGGASWITLDGAESYEYTSEKKCSFAPGMILLRDAAGNLSMNAEEVVLDKLPSSGGGGGGGSGSGGTTVPHASGDGDDARYNAYELELPEGEVQTLLLGGEPVELSLELEGEDGAQSGAFTAELIRWARAGEQAGAEGALSPDTLLLRAAEEADEEGKLSLTWKINGAALRKLFNSDVRYLLLDANGAMLSLPTQGFVAGTRYAQLKMQGVSTQAFDYEVRMRFPAEEAGAERAPFNRAAGCAASICVEVQGERYELLDRSATPEMYALDVYCAAEDLPEYPYGAHPAFAEGADTEEAIG